MSCQDTTGYEDSSAIVSKLLEQYERLAGRVGMLEILVHEMTKVLLETTCALEVVKADTEIIRREQK